jgi:hypothetical protein
MANTSTHRLWKSAVSGGAPAGVPLNSAFSAREVKYSASLLQILALKTPRCTEGVGMQGARRAMGRQPADGRRAHHRPGAGEGRAGPAGEK